MAETLRARSSFVRRAVGRSSPLRRMDGVLFGAVLALSVLGTLLVWSSTRTWDSAEPTALAKKHVINVCAGLALYSVVSVVDYRWLRRWAPLIYGVALAGLVLVLTPLGATINNTRSWIQLGGGFAVQPAELAKPALVVMAASLLTPTAEGTKDRPRYVNVAYCIAVWGVTAFLVMCQPDLGTTIMLTATMGAMIVFSGLRKRFIFAGLAAGVLTAVAVWHLNLLKPYQMARFTALMDPSTDPRGIGYNSTQALLAVGSGELFGKGLFHGGQTTGRFVPEQHTDFIFTVAGEELGFVGSVTLVLLLGVVLLRGVRIARECNDRFAALVAGGLVAWLAFQSLVNIGMTIGIMPITGVPLPFVSYGGTATFANMIAVGLLQAIHVRRPL
ncbi:rod shape-determining protein RodA [Thermobispora bispora]|uniref:peptidoglycan glycosyltransferase n=1 Tax=Thermobispora bispora (strain ATCC 19993 / DSM 43833 / CBS 139.67 / JCM 10125 / KCTC 9307 / NBRC 14880 / R51) TaxID=469371 RepID=D6Y4J1_THEBD|nr:rod shape-determining protein RodA [Thermobispora bispora]ADG89167.1 rod shape-determining protein RodA [Thermobispora bispora DSM 43833]MBO2474281.1 rod shape-determining protein RodA [Actinomycetales bacterium]MBX6166532.1 rod shape-determining protein RodA [Thermobispora bispora]QSI48877.1 rod shape-determining protein RodA [Thermobispora bispora]